MRRRISITVICYNEKKDSPDGFMESAVSSQNIDQVLLGLLHTQEIELPAALDKILNAQAEPVITRILRYRMQGSTGVTPAIDLEDVHSEVVLRLLTRLQDFVGNPEQRGIGDFSRYVAVVTHNACNDYFREKYPEHSRLKNRLRYLLKHHEAFSIWESKDQELLCGLAQWRDTKLPVRTEKFHQLQNNPASWERKGGFKEDLAQLVKEIFVYLESPLLLDDLVNTAAVLLGINEKITQKDSIQMEQLPGPSNEKESVEDHAEYLTRLWEEIQKLPGKQRKALLLNLKDSTGLNVIPLFPHTGIAGIRQIASVLDMSDIDLARLWPELPMEDSKIAAFMSLTRQQVINLRKSARERLARRMKAFEQQARVV